MKTVVLPAPFGPMIDVMLSFFAEKVRSSIATRPPNFIVRFCTSSKVSLINYPCLPIVIVGFLFANIPLGLKTIIRTIAPPKATIL